MGELISREALCYQVKKLKREAEQFNAIDYTTGYISALSYVEGMIAHLETVDAEPVITGETSDGYHTFNELYHHRAVLFSVIIKAFSGKAWKAKKHEDGSMYDGMFIVGVETPDGQATYHYDIDPYWEMFKCRELEYAPKWDGHTPQEAIERIGKLEPVRHGMWIESYAYGAWHYDCPFCDDGYSTKEREEKPVNYCPNCGAKMDAKDMDVPG